MNDDERERRQRELAEKRRKLEQLRQEKQRRLEQEHSNANRLANLANGDAQRPNVDEDLEAILRPLDISPTAPAPLLNGTAAAGNHVGDAPASLGRQRPTKLPQLEQIVVEPISVAPKNGVSYSKTTQTDDERASMGEFSMGSQEFDFDELSVTHHQLDIDFDGSPEQEIAKILPNMRLGRQRSKEVEEEEPPPPERVPDLTEEEKRKILNDQRFQQFFAHSAKVFERAIAEDDIYIDYVRDQGAEEKVDNGELLIFNREFFDEKWSKKRMVQALDFSEMHPELMATAYSDDQSDVLAPAGVVHLWNTRFKNHTPEHTFHSNSRVMSMLFARYHSNLVIGGLYSGRICMWDNRVNKKTPVCQSPLSSNAHTQPVLAMKVVGTKNAHDLVTVSTDGRLCSWSIDSIHAPIEVVDLNAKDHRQVPAVSMSFFANNINSFAVGCEDGFLFVGDRHGTKGEMSRSIRAHSAPVRSVDMHRAAGHVDFSPLCVSGSLDFSVKLWNLKDSELLLSLERKHRHYVTDVQWSPVHPAVFISTDIDGMLNLWNLNVDTETPVSSIQVENGITRALWSHNGQQLVAADHKGKVSLFDVHESLWNVRPNEWEQLAETLKDVKLASTTEEASPQPPQSALATIDAGRPSLPAGFSFDGRQSIGFDGRASIGFDGRASLQPGSLQYA